MTEEIRKGSELALQRISAQETSCKARQTGEKGRKGRERLHRQHHKALLCVELGLPAEGEAPPDQTSVVDMDFSTTPARCRREAWA